MGKANQISADFEDDFDGCEANSKITRREMIKRCTLGALGLSFGGTFLGALNWPTGGFAATGTTPVKDIFKGGAPKKIWKWSKEAYHTRKLEGAYQCGICPNMCVLEEGDRSFCRVRVHRNGKMYTLVYGNAIAVHVDPIEKKPLNHFLPQTGAFSIATAGCNFRCLNCQNWELSQKRPEETAQAKKPYFIDLFPKTVVELAVKTKCTSIAYTYNEPTIFYEYMYDTSQLAREKGIKNVWVTNGYMSRAPLLQFCKYLDAANVDLKSFDDGIYRKLNSGKLQPVLDTLTTLAEEGVWFEVTNLIVPTYTDDMTMIRKMCKWLYKNIGPDYPLHFSRFHPLYKLKHLPATPLVTLKKARETALDEGMHYVYIGNVPGTKAQNTHCPKCGKLLIERKGYYVLQYNLDGDKCKFCSEKIAGVWRKKSEKTAEKHSAFTGGRTDIFAG